MAAMTSLVLPSILRTLQLICHAVLDAGQHFILFAGGPLCRTIFSEENFKWAKGVRRQSQRGHHFIVNPKVFHKRGRSQMAQAQNGDTVKVHYTGKLDNGTVFDSSTDREPLEFKLGNDQLIPGFENAVLGMNAGESKTVKIVAAEAYGPHRQEMVLVVNRDEFPDDIDPKVGEQLRMQDPNGQEFRVRVTDTSEETVTLDGNHPLAGEDLTFDLQLVEIG